MTATYGIPFGPTFNPLYEPDGAYFWDDFVAYSASTTADAGVWVDVSTSGTEVASASEPWGAVAITNNDAAGEDGGIELNGEPFAFDHTKDLLFVCQLKASSITGGNIFVGLHTEGFDVSSGSLVSTHLGFLTRGAASIEFSASDGTSQTIDDTSVDLVANTYVIVVFKWNAANLLLSYFVDGAKKGSMNLADDALPASGTQMTLGLHNEFQSAASTLTVGYVGVAGER